MRRWTSRCVAGLFAVTLAAAPAEAQPIAGASALTAPRVAPMPLVAADTTGSRAPQDNRTAAATGRTVLFSTAGAVLGAVAGGLIGATLASDELPCRNGDPDGCLGAQLPRAIWGAGIGITVMTPLAAHAGNRKRGNLAYTMLTSAALFAGEVIALNALVEDGRTEHKGTAFGIAIGVPVLQVIATSLVERATAKRVP